MPWFRCQTCFAKRSVANTEAFLPWSVSSTHRLRLQEIWSACEGVALIEDTEPAYTRPTPVALREYLVIASPDGEDWYLRVDVTDRGALVRNAAQAKMRELVAGLPCVLVLHTCRHALNTVTACAETVLYSGVA